MVGSSFLAVGQCEAPRLRAAFGRQRPEILGKAAKLVHLRHDQIDRKADAQLFPQIPKTAAQRCGFGNRFKTACLHARRLQHLHDLGSTFLGQRIIRRELAAPDRHVVGETEHRHLARHLDDLAGDFRDQRAH